MQKFRIFVVLGIASLGVLSFFYIYQNMWRQWGGVYTIKVEVPDTGSLAIGTSVFMNGVKIGSVRDVYLGQNSVVMDLEIKKGVKIPVGSKIQITTVGMIGNLKVSIFRPKEFRGYLKDGDLMFGQGPVSTAVMLEKATELAEQVNEVIKDLNISDLSKSVNKILHDFTEEGSENLVVAIENLKEATEEITKILKSGELKGSIENVKNITGTISRLMRIGLVADIEWTINGGGSYNGEIGISLANVFFSKKGFDKWDRGYSIFLKKTFGGVALGLGMIYNSFGAVANWKITDNFRLGLKAYNLPSPEYKVELDMIMGSLVFGPRYNLREGSILFSASYQAEL